MMAGDAIAKRDPATVATPELRNYPVHGDVDQLAQHLRARLRELSLPVHETRIVPAGGRQYLLRPRGEGYEFGLVPRDALPAETVHIAIEDGVATISGEPLVPRFGLVRGFVKAILYALFFMYVASAVFTAIGMAFGVGLGFAASVLSLVGLVFAVFRRQRDDPLHLRRRRQRDVLTHVERAVRPMLRAALPGVPYR